MVNQLQDQFTIQASSHDPFPEPQWDKSSMLVLRAEYEQEFQQYDQYEARLDGTPGRGKRSNPASGGGGSLGTVSRKGMRCIINYTGPADPNQCYAATYEVPNNDAFLVDYGVRQ